MAKSLRISLETGQVDVPVPGPDTGEQERSERALEVVSEIAAELDEVEGLVDSNPRGALTRLWVLRQYLDAYPVRWIRNYARRKDHNDAADRVAVLRQRATSALGDEAAQQVWDDLDYLKVALPLLYEKFRVRGEVLRLILTPLGKLEHAEIRYQREDAEDLSRLCQDVAEHIRATVDLEEEVQRWGEENYPALLTEDAPPARLPPGEVASSGPGWLLVLLGLGGLGAGAAIFMGKLMPEIPGGPTAPGAAAAGVGLLFLLLGAARLAKASRQRRQAPEEFKALAARFRERLYLICCLRVLNRMASRYSQAAEGFGRYVRQHGGTPRWKRVKLQEKDLTQLFVPDADSWHEKETIEHWLAEQLKQTFRLDSSTLVSPGELSAEDWEVMLRAYLLETLDDRPDKSPDEAILLDTVSDILFNRRGEDVEAERQRVFQEVFAAWDRMVTRRAG